MDSIGPDGMWGSGGRAYDEISYAVSDALAHAAQRLAPAPGEKILDVATGTGWTARNVARSGASVTAVDFAAELLAAAEALSQGFDPPIVFKRGDAEALPFPDGAFDGVISTFGVMFAADQERAARELGRVCRKGGRLALATWPPQGAVARFFGLVSKYAPPRSGPSPLNWGDPEKAAALLKRDFDVAFETGVSRSYYPDADHVVKKFEAGFGPVVTTMRSLDATARAAFRDELVRYHEEFRTAHGVSMAREYLIVLGRRR